MINSSISIIIPAYNVECYLSETLDSIKSQTQPPDEVILINDGSTDSTLDIANSYKFSFPYKIISINNNGQGNARNFGISLATSKYVYFLDADDIIDNELIKSIKEQIASNRHPDIILFSGQSFNDINYKGNRWLDYRRNFSGYFENSSTFLNEGMLNRGLFCQPCLYVSKKSLWGINGISFGNYYLEDDAIFYPLLFSCKNYLVLDKVFFYRRNREDSVMTMKPNLKHLRGALNCINTTINLYESKRFSKQEKRHLIKKLEDQCFGYLFIAKAAELKPSYHMILNAIYVTRSMHIMFKFLFYISRLQPFFNIEKFKRIIKRLIKYTRR